MLPERSAVEEARANIAREREAVRQQQEADKLFAQMYIDCATLLEGSPESRVRGNLYRRFLLGLPLIILASLFPPWFHLRRIPNIDLVDFRRITTSLNGTGEPIEVTLRSDNAVPTKLKSPVDLSIPGLQETLRMHPTHADILSPDIYNNPHSEYSCFIRKANLMDVSRFQPVVWELTQPHA
ncbi:hypothetical protein HY387_00590 [Candidatus Daviesbacteria bacterium]|nr:hypothetical protein [Candidatus Daviesbacteria bacterium]